METGEQSASAVSRRAVPAAPRNGAGAPLVVSFADGQGLLTLDHHSLGGGLLIVERLEVEIPNLRLPADLTMDAGRLRNRRGRFRGATLAIQPGPIGVHVASRDLAAAGLSDVLVSVDATGAWRLGARARLGGCAAGVTARIAVRRQGQRRLRVAVEDVHLFGFLPVPAPLLAGALLAAVLPPGFDGRPAAELGARTTVRWSADIDLLDLALLETLVAGGWRLPDCSTAALETIASSTERLVLVFGDAAPSAAAESERETEGAAKLIEADGLLGRGDHPGALACLRQAPGETVGPTAARIAERTLQLLLAGAATLAEADALATRMLAGDPASLPALLAQAVVAAERADARRAAERYLAAAEIADRLGHLPDAAFARAAAAALGADTGARAADGGADLVADFGPPGAAPVLVSGVPTPMPLTPSQRLALRCEELVAQGDFVEADRLYGERIDRAADDSTAALLATERARVRLLGPGAAPALSVLRTIPPRTAPEEALVLRADLGERLSSLDDALPALEELAARAGAAGETAAQNEFSARADALRVRVLGRAPTPVDELERTLGAHPTDGAAADELAAAYLAVEDPRARIEALGGLLRRALSLSPARRTQLYASLGETAESIGDLAEAEQAYWRAATIEADPRLRADHLVARARVLLARGDVQTALADLEEALARAPDHPAALALAADTAFAQQDWPHARQLYAALAGAPGAADVISREQLMVRRAELAEAAGDDAEAETCYREVAILDPRNIEARRVLGEIALRRQDLGGGALRLEEVLRLLPLDALDELLDVRLSLGSVYVQLEDWSSAKYYLELVLAQDPARVPALELLVGAYLQLGLAKEAAVACERLARLYGEPAKRARILYRKGEILRAELGDDDAAFDAFLKASDIDPRFTPTMVRLIEYFWRQGDFLALAEVAADLVKASPPAAHADPALGARIAVGTALAGRPLPAMPGPRGGATPALGRHAVAAGSASDAEARAAAQAVAEAGDHLESQPLEMVDLALTALAAWAGEAVLPKLVPALAAAVEEDPARVGPVRALARIADRRQQPALARALYALLAFVDPSDAATDRLRALGPAPAVTPEALQAFGPSVHPDSGGPLRAALVAMAAALQGFGSESPPSGGAQLRPARAAGLRRLGQLLQAPPFAATVAAPASAQAPAGEPPPIVVSPTRPAMLLVSEDAAALPEREWGFAAGRALEELRSGLPSVARLSADELRSFLGGVAAALAGAPAPGEPTAEAAARWFTASDAIAELPVGEARARLAADVQAVLGGPLDWAAFRAGSAHTSNRVGLLACGSPQDALAVLARGDNFIATAPDEEERRAARRAFLRGPTARELVRYLLSGAYEQAVAPPPAAS
ncbi:MAG TPA: tetratricopeptide repeat protein [Polyangia bacterium]|nr:tetratricopeptide repeat protein [Polyangia bacterium]